MTRLTLSALLMMTASAAASEMAQTMADGNAWTMEDPSGRNAKLTLNPDGTGRVKLGFMGTGANWVATEDGLCLTTRPLGEVCVALQPTETGYVGTATDGNQFVFSR